ncbi:MAG: hypothetical protein J6S23_00640 [Clostridia bacterium]|nr:hypothetical protein [Clostridia bacterium]
MWLICLIISISALVLMGAISIAVNNSNYTKKHRFKLLWAFCGAVLIAAVVMFIPIHYMPVASVRGAGWRAFLLSVFNSIQIFMGGCEFGVIKEGLAFCPNNLYMLYQIWSAILLIIAPILTFSFVLSMLKNIFAYIRYYGSFFKDVYVFSELNDRSLALANNIRSNSKKAVIVFTDVFGENEESMFELIEEAKKLRAICFKEDILVINFKRHYSKKTISFFTIGIDETENLNQGLKLIERYKQRENTNLYIFSTNVESELLLCSTDDSVVKVRRINEVQSLINRVLYERGQTIFDSARENDEGTKDISAVVIGMGRHGTEMVKALSWFGQMDGYNLEINAFDKDPLAEEKFMALAPELMSDEYNGVAVDGEACYKITVHPGFDVESISFVKEIHKITNATYVLVALGNDEANIRTAVNLRMYFERMKIHPVIQAIIYNTQQKNALMGVKNFKGQDYDIDFIGDREAIYAMDVIIDSELEQDALQRHLKWGKEDDFWNYEYNYRSSIASAIHMKARVERGIPGANKAEAELSDEERHIIEVLEHKRWNAYMRSEGYIFSGSNDKNSRNDLAKMHHDLVDFSSLTEEEKRKDSSVGTK